MAWVGEMVLILPVGRQDLPLYTDYRYHLRWLAHTQKMSSYRGFCQDELDKQYSPSKWVQRMPISNVCSSHCKNLIAATESAKRNKSYSVEMDVPFDPEDLSSTIHFIR